MRLEIHLSNRVTEHYAWFKAESGTEKGPQIIQQASDLKICKTEEVKWRRQKKAQSREGT